MSDSLSHNLSITDVLSTSGFDKTGSDFKGEHPIHGSNTGSNLAISPKENGAYCFRHNVGGGPLEWIALKEGIIGSCEDLEHGLRGQQFVEACKAANRVYGADIQIEDVDEEEVEKRSNIREVLSEAANRCHGQLTQNQDRVDTIKSERGLEDDDIEEFLIGEWTDAITDYLESQYTPEALLGSGLFKANHPETDPNYDEDSDDNSYKSPAKWQEELANPEEYNIEDLLYPIIAGRITFPYTRFGRVEYMIGRRTREQEDYWYSEAENNTDEIREEFLDNPKTDAEDMQEATDTWVNRKCGKYVKICETPYNQHIIWQEFKDREDLVITEGIYDAISVSKSGYSVASPITTRFNEKDRDKVLEVAKQFDRTILVFDGDTAGKEGQEKTAKDLVEAGIDPVMVTLEAGTDFDDWTNENGYDIEPRLEEGTRYLDQKIEEAEEAGERQATKIREEIYRQTHDWKERRLKWVFKKLSGRTSSNKSDWKEVREEVKREKQRERKSEQVPSNDTEEEEQITSELTVPNPGEVIHLNPRPDLVVNQLEQTACGTKVNEVGTVDKEPRFKIYEIQFGQGNEENTYKLLVEPHQIINKGEEKLPIKTASLTKDLYRDSEYFKQEYRNLKENNEDYTKSYEQFLKEREGTEYLELQDRIDVRSREVIQELDNDTILSLIQEYLRKAYRTDPKLRTVMYPKIIQHDKSQVRPDNISKYAPHTQMWTNTKVGKSHTSDRIGRRYEDATPAGLLGYADSDGKEKGMIDGLDLGVFIDEFDFGSSSEQLNDHLLSLMEQGKFEQVKAGHSIKTRFYGSMTYMANPKEADMPSGEDDMFGEFGDDRSQFELVSKFEQLIQVLGMNIQAMASRFGVIVFDDDMQTAEPMDDKDLSNERFEKLETFVEWARREIAKEYTDIERELEHWLEQEYEEDYRNRIEELAEGTQNEKVKKFWKNHIYSFRHARGQALRMAVYQYAGDVIKGTYSIDEIREEAESQWQQVKDINRQSLENMTQATDTEMMKRRARNKADNYEPKYLRLFIKSAIKHHQSNSVEEVGKVFPLSTLKQVFEDIREELPDQDVNEDSRYWKWSKVEKQVAANINQKRLEVEQDFGVELLKRDNEEMFRVKVPERFKPYLKLDIGESDPYSGNDSSDGGGSGGDGSDSSSDSEGSVGFEESETSIKISGDYKPTFEGVKRLFGENADSYGGTIPHDHLVKYFGRKYDGRRQSDLEDSLEQLMDEGYIMDEGGSYLKL